MKYIKERSEFKKSNVDEEFHERLPQSEEKLKELWIYANNTINESDGNKLTLYHGTSLSSGLNLVDNGWKPYSGSMGGNMGQNKYLYLTTEPENARWFANEKGEDTIVEVSDIPIEFLKPDPEDEAGFTMKELLDRTSGPSNFVLFKELESGHFKIM